MFEPRLQTAVARWALCSLAFPLLLTQCATTRDETSDTPRAGAGGNAAPIGAAGALGGASSAGVAAIGEGGAAGNPLSDGRAGDSSAGSAAVEAGAGGSAGGAPAGAECGSELRSFDSPSAAHVAVCSPLSYPMNPPVYGDHYPVWAAYKSYSFPVPLGFLVHNLEHGAVVLLYNCAAGCADEVAAAQAFILALPADPRCSDDVKHQIVMSPDPSLPQRWAAVAWGHSLTAECFAESDFRAFYEAHVGHGSEDICSDGADLSADACQ